MKIFKSRCTQHIVQHAAKELSFGINKTVTASLASMQGQARLCSVKHLHVAVSSPSIWRLEMWSWHWLRLDKGNGIIALDHLRWSASSPCVSDCTQILSFCDKQEVVVALSLFPCYVAFVEFFVSFFALNSYFLLCGNAVFLGHLQIWPVFMRLFPSNAHLSTSTKCLSPSTA